MLEASSWLPYFTRRALHSQVNSQTTGDQATASRIQPIIGYIHMREVQQRSSTSNSASKRVQRKPGGCEGGELRADGVEVGVAGQPSRPVRSVAATLCVLILARHTSS
ncbi:hypothetical protein Y032_0511g2739 [Ancylostoma ceylanicum]|uniref:Uncharacterized protein n=1 Tax=Ancylostoma ceylanicum TaxID=53326 RepID=A0A016WTC3_9BILA|nr:hypothetical protein Y032_0511g2739 [Ancylostoma ceylanicum]